MPADVLITVGPTARSDDDDYDIDFYTADSGVQENMDPEKPSPREQLEVSQAWSTLPTFTHRSSVFGWPPPLL